MIFYVICWYLNVVDHIHFADLPSNAQKNRKEKMSDLVPFEPHAVGQSGFCAHLQ